MAGTNKRRSAKPLTKDDARRIAANTAKRPEFLRKSDQLRYKLYRTGLRRTAGMGRHENLCSINVYALITYECCVSPTSSRVRGKSEYIDRETGRRHRARRRAIQETERDAQYKAALGTMKKPIGPSDP
jgi:hypothetical protein